MKPQLSGSHRRTYDGILRHPAARNLGWRDVRSMLGALAEVVEESNGDLKVTRHGQTLVLRPSLDKNVAESEELMQIRHFLERFDAASPEAAAEGVHLLVVIDHRQARVYKTEVHGSVPQRVTPYDPGGFGRHLHYVQKDSNGQRKPERRSFYEAVAKTLQGAEEILVFGSGTGASSAMEELLAQLNRHHADVAKRIVGSIVLDETHLTENQLLARARDLYAGIASRRNQAFADGGNRIDPMIKPHSTMAQQLAQAVMAFQQKTTGHAPKAVTVVLSQDTLVVTLHEALSPAERDMARSPAGAAKLQEFHRQLFSTSSQSLREEVQRITGVEVREAVAEVEPSSGAVVCAFASGTMVQVFQLAQGVSMEQSSGGGIG